MSEDVLASDAEREHAVGRLRDASADGRLTLEELADRIARAYRARTNAELERVTSDLPATHAPAKTVTRLVSILSPLRRRGRWRLGERASILSVLGPVELDLRGSEIPAGEVTLRLVGVFSPVTVVVPRHVAVELSVASVMGPVSGPADPDGLPPLAPRLRIEGVSVLAPVTVRYSD